MQQSQQLYPGDRVRVCCSLANLPKGSVGIVQRAFHTVALYDVLFEERHMLYVLRRHELVLLPHGRAREVGR